MSGALRISRRPTLERPVLIAAFRGWNDGGQGASLATGYLVKHWAAQRFAELDPEQFFDFQATRPTVRLEEDLSRRIEWPETAFYHARPDGLGRDVLLLLGIEPNLRWREFTETIVSLVQELGCDLAITLGALLADVPHTRATPVTGSATDPELVDRLGLSTSRYEGPTGIVGVLHDACRRAEISSASLWAAVPHYVSLAPSPKAASALCGRLGTLLGITIETTELDAAGEAYERQVTEAIATDEDTAAYVEELERRADELEESDLPSGEALAEALTRYLREREQEGNGAPPSGGDA